MNISWNEIKSRAMAFSKEWGGRPLPQSGAESAERQTYLNEFFAVFGKKRRHVASFEEPVKNLKGNWSKIDLLWPGTLLVEHKSPGEDLGKAHSQGMKYIQSLISSGRDADAPRYLLVTDFERICLHDLEPEQDPNAPLFKRIPPVLEFPLADLHKQIHAFGFMAGFRTRRVRDEDPANIEAAELLAHLHDVLESGGYPRKDIDKMLVRVLFCLFAEDTGIFEAGAFSDYIENFTRPDGSDLGMHLDRLFRVLDTEVKRRQGGLDQSLADLPYVNGRLFADRLEFADFTTEMRAELLAAGRFNWARISPAVFGSLFQSVMQPKERRQLGAHYTGERDILKLLHSLFLDDLHAEFASIKENKGQRRTFMLEAFQKKLAGINILDPACGCGNFLVLAYRELRYLEILVLKELHPGQQGELTLDEINRLSLVDVDQFYGIEIEEWPARIAEVAVWLMDHLMNQELSAAFGQLYQRLPLKKSATIARGNALRMDWNTVLKAAKCTYVLGNPPFIGKHLLTAGQSEDIDLVWRSHPGTGVLDYVSGWYRKAADYISGTSIRCAFVSTNSITQGEQVGVLWNYLFGRGLKIHFAHRTFAWKSEARGKAHVHVVILGFGYGAVDKKHIFDYHNNPDQAVVSVAQNISPYLVDGPDMALPSRSTPLCDVPSCMYGNKPTDGGYLIIEESDRALFLKENPLARKYLRPLLCADEYLNGIPRWCLWLVDADPGDLLKSPGVRARIDGVKKFRLASSKEPTRRKAAQPTLFAEIRQPDGDFIVIPRHSSEKRSYVPFGYFDKNTIIHDSCTALPNATLYHFGVLSSAMHMAWMMTVCGRIKSDFRYSNTLVYNNYPWPANVAPERKALVEECASKVLSVRASYIEKGQTLASLYHPDYTPEALLNAHKELDRAVEKCYRKESFEDDRKRVEYLFALYQGVEVPLLPVVRRGRKAK